MKQWIGILLCMVFVTSMNSCYNTTISKPKELIPKDEFVKMMVHVYLVQGIENSQQSIKELQKVTQTDLYYSVLKKYSVTDSVFIRSLIYYSSFPREYERMHVQIMDIMNEAELQLKPQEQLELEVK